MAPLNSPDRTTRPVADGDRHWFYLPDVVPLALHAASTPNLVLTAAQLAAFTPLIPALTWQAVPDGATLTSNGMPGWHDEDGRVHVARAHTWHRRATPAGPVPDRSGYLPLVSSDGDPHLLNWLIGASRRAHWLSIDTSSQWPMITTGQLGVTDQHGGPYPADAVWNPAVVACVPHTGSGRYPALVADGYLNIHDGALARFDADTVTRMIRDLDDAYSAGGNGRVLLTRLRWAGQRLEVLATTPSATRRVDVIGPDADGLYPVGAHLWTWLPLNDH